MDFIGRSGSSAFFSNGNSGVVIDTDFNLVTEIGDFATLKSSRSWEQSEEQFADSVLELASGAVTTLNIRVVTASAGRMYTIPDGVQAEAQKALDWHAKEHRGGTPVGLNTARILAKGGQIGLHKVRHIAKYFPRHEVDKKGKGWEPGEDNFPSNGRIAWALWGGDSAWRWAKAIVERENKKAITADGYALPDYDASTDYYFNDDYDSDLTPFEEAFEETSNAPEFLARVRMDGAGIDRLYMLDSNGNNYVWDGSNWDDLGYTGGDIYTYDNALDDPSDSCEKDHYIIDPGSAVVISAMLQQNPFTPVGIDEIDHDEAQAMLDGLSDEDWQMIDYAVTAGAYTPEERSKNTQSQMRDATGKFATMGGKVVVGGDAANGSGTITGVDKATGNVRVQLDNGKAVEVPAKITAPQGSATAGRQASQPKNPALDPIELGQPLDTSGILGLPRTPENQPAARLSGTLPPITAQDLHDGLYNWKGWVAQQRASAKSDAANSIGVLKNGVVVSQSMYSSTSGPGGSTSTWTSTTNPNGITSAGNVPATAPKPVVKANEPTVVNTPDKTDVPAMYFAIVSPDDPGAVMELVAIVPATNKSTEPAAYKRDNKQWIPDEQIVNDLKSATPPPVVPLDATVLNTVLKQVDGLIPVSASAGARFVEFILKSMTASSERTAELADDHSDDDPCWDGYKQIGFKDKNGKHVPNCVKDASTITAAAEGGLDRNRGNAEKLRRYWVHGPGAAKIRWGTGGDWARCVRHLSKYLGVRAKGYCQLRHKDALGYYTATHAKMDRKKHHQFSIETDLQTFTQISEEQFNLALSKIISAEDPSYDFSWKPDADIIELFSNEDAITAAGGLDRNRGDAEKLRRYWVHGAGAAKIRWGEKGDWSRCVRHLAKYLGIRAKGYCQLRHKEALGFYTATHAKMDRKHNFSFDETFTNAVVEQAALTARANEARKRFGLIASADMTEGASGAAFSIPLVIPEGVESGDGRKFEPNVIEIRELPLPLLWQIHTGDGHSGSVVVGRIEKMERIDGGIGNATGVFDTGEYGKEAQRLVQNGFLRGVSADLDQFEAKEHKESPTGEADTNDVEPSKLTINHARVMAVTIVAKPAFQQCTISIVGDQENNMIPEDGVYEEQVDSTTPAEPITASGFLATEIPVTPPAEWFANPKLTGPTPLTVDDSGRVFGHIAAWHVNHIGLPNNTKPPRSRSGYSYFHTGVVRTDAGKDVPVGQLTLAGGHASLHASAQAAAKHYDDTASAIADVHAGEDQYGIWVAGSLRPDASERQIRALRASAPSGDWRPVGGSLELVAVCQVNVPGFPIARALMASGQVVALVAAGAHEMAMLRNDPATRLAQKAAYFNLLGAETSASDMSARIESARSRMDAEFTYISRDDRMKMAEKGQALPDGSFPIVKADDVRAAIHAYGRAKDSKKADVRKHIMKRARQLNVRHLIPEAWKTQGAASITASVNAMREKIDVVSALSEFAQIDPSEREKLAKEGKAMPDGSYPIRNVKDLKNAIKAYGRATAEDKPSVKKHIIKRAKALGRPDLVPDSWGVTASAAPIHEAVMVPSSSAIYSTVKNMREKIAAITAAGEVAPTADGEAPAEPAQPITQSDVERLKEVQDKVEQADKEAKDNPQAPVTPEGSKEVDAEGRPKYTPKTQPRDDRGKFREVLAHLKQDLGVSGLQDAQKEVQKIENLDFAGNYKQSAESAQNLLETLDKLDTGTLDNKSIENVRLTAKELGKVISNTPLGFEEQAEKVRFSDLPPALKNLMSDMVERVGAKIGKKDGDVATADVRGFMSGVNLYSQSDISKQMSTMLRLLT